LDHFYRAEDISNVAELKGSILFFKSPLETLRFKEPPPPAPVEGPEEPPTAVVNPRPAADAAAAGGTPPATPPEAGKGDLREGSGVSRAIGRRPYSFQARVKDRDKE